jgi:hypothetical protein
VGNEVNQTAQQQLEQQTFGADVEQKITQTSLQIPELSDER